MTSMINVLRLLGTMLHLSLVERMIAVLLFSYGMPRRDRWLLVWCASLVLQIAVYGGLYFGLGSEWATAYLGRSPIALVWPALSFCTLLGMGACEPRETLLRFIGAQALQNALWSVQSMFRTTFGLNLWSEASIAADVALMALVYGAAWLLFRPYLTQRFTCKNARVLVLALVLLYLKDIFTSGALENLSDISVDLLAISVLFGLFNESELEQRVDVMERTLVVERRERELSREQIEIINRKCHDLKHQVTLMAAADGEDLTRYRDELTQSLEIYDTSVNTGSETLDVILMEKLLVCHERGIHLSFVVDGRALSCLRVSDVASLFGNALDNAVEYVSGLAPEERTIFLRVARSKGFLSICCENPLVDELEIRDGLPVTTKGGTMEHGFGLASIDYIAHQYGGVASVKAEDGRFVLSVLVPVG